MDWKFLPHPAYLPDLAPSDYHLSWPLSNLMRDRNFDDEDHVKSYLKDFFDSKSQKFGTDKIYNLHRRWVEVKYTLQKKKSKILFLFSI